MGYFSAPLHKPGEQVAFRSIFEELDEQGRGTKHYIACATGDVLPDTDVKGHHWVERTIYDLQSGIS